MLLQSNSENLLTENFIQDAFRLSLSDVEIVIQCLLSKLLMKFSITIVFEALDDVVHCELRHIVCTELCFHNDLRLSSRPLRYSLGLNLSRSSSLHSTCQSFTSVSNSANFSSIRPWNCGTCSSSLRSVVPDIAEDLSSATNVNLSIPNRRVSRSVNNRAMTSHETQLLHDTSGPT